MKLNINGKVLEVSDEELSKAIEEKKESFELKSDFVIRSTEEDATYKENIHKEGIVVGAEIGRKEVLKGFELEGQGHHKSDDSAIAAIKGFMTTNTSNALKDANIEPDKKVAELTKDIETLRGVNASQLTTIQDKDNMFATFKKESQTNSEYEKYIPDNIAMPRQDVITLMKAGIKLDIDDNSNVFGVGTDGQPLKDITLNLLPVKDVMSNFFNTNPHLLKGSSGGAGGADGGDGNGKQDLETFSKEMSEAGHSVNSPKYVEVMQERMKAGTLDI